MDISYKKATQVTIKEISLMNKVMPAVKKLKIRCKWGTTS
jgi:hypothetical protein